MNVGLDIAGCPGRMAGIHIATSQDGMDLRDSIARYVYLTHISLQLQQVIGSIFVDSATRAPVTKVILSSSIHALRVKMLMEMGESTTYQQHVFLYAFRSGPMLARTHTHISPCPHPGKYVIQKSRSPIRLDVDYIFLRYQNPCSKSVMCPLLSGATCTGHRRASARFADNRCCPAVCIPESVRPMASGKVMPRECGLHSRNAREHDAQTAERAASKLPHQ